MNERAFVHTISEQTICKGLNSINSPRRTSFDIK